MDRKGKTEPIFGSFLQSCVKHAEDPETMDAGSPPRGSDSDLIVKAYDRAVAPRRAKEALAASQATEAARQEDRKEFEALKRAMEGLRKGKSTDGRCRLWTLFALAKKACPKQGRRFNHTQLARWVDKYLGKEGGLRAVCPTSWLEVKPIPSTASEALSHPVLQERVRSFIARAK